MFYYFWRWFYGFDTSAGKDGSSNKSWFGQRRRRGGDHLDEWTDLEDDLVIEPDALDSGPVGPPPGSIVCTRGDRAQECGRSVPVVISDSWLREGPKLRRRRRKPRGSR